MELRNNYEPEDFNYSGEEGLKITVAHEFHHCVQQNYFKNGWPWKTRWFSEGTAVYMEDQNYSGVQVDNINSYKEYANIFYASPKISLNQRNTGNQQYSTALYWMFLGEQYPGALENVYNEFEVNNNTSVLKAIGAALGDEEPEDCGEKFKKLFEDFSLALYLPTHPEYGFEDNGNEDLRPLRDKLYSNSKDKAEDYYIDKYNPESREVIPKERELPHLASNYIIVSTSAINKSVEAYFLADGITDKDWGFGIVKERHDGTTQKVRRIRMAEMLLGNTTYYVGEQRFENYTQNERFILIPARISYENEESTQTYNYKYLAAISKPGYLKGMKIDGRNGTYKAYWQEHSARELVIEQNDAIESGPAEFTFYFNRSMDTTTVPTVTFEQDDWPLQSVGSFEWTETEQKNDTLIGQGVIRGGDPEFYESHVKVKVRAKDIAGHFTDGIPEYEPVTSIGNYIMNKVYPEEDMPFWIGYGPDEPDESHEAFAVEDKFFEKTTGNAYAIGSKFYAKSNIDEHGRAKVIYRDAVFEDPIEFSFLDAAGGTSEYYSDPEGWHTSERLYTYRLTNYDERWNEIGSNLKTVYNYPTGEVEEYLEWIDEYTWKKKYQPNGQFNLEDGVELSTVTISTTSVAKHWKIELVCDVEGHYYGPSDYPNLEYEVNGIDFKRDQSLTQKFKDTQGPPAITKSKQASATGSASSSDGYNIVSAEGRYASTLSSWTPVNVTGGALNSNYVEFEYTVPEELHDGSHVIQLKVLNEAGERDAIYAGFRFTVDATPPEPITTLSSQIVSETTDMELSWSPARDETTGVKEYRAYRATEEITDIAGMTPIVTLSSDTLSYTDTTAEENKTYYYTVVSEDLAGNVSTVSNSPFVETPNIYPPSVPQGLKAEAGENSITLTWQTNIEDDLAGYRIYRDEGDGFAAIADVSGDITEYDDTGLIGGNTYYYKITAYDTTDNDSGYSEEVSVVPIDVTAPETITDLTAEVIAETTDIQLNWSSAEDVAGIKEYRVYRSTKPFTLPWTMEYDGSVLPHESTHPWNRGQSGEVIEKIVNDNLYYNGAPYSSIFYYKLWEVDSSVGYTVEFRMKWLQGNSGNNFINFSMVDEQFDIQLAIEKERIRKLGPGIIEYHLDTSKFHTYRIVREESLGKVFIDGNLAFTIKQGNTPWINGIFFGDWGGGYGYSEAYWDYVRYYDGGAIEPAKTEDPIAILSEADSSYVDTDTEEDKTYYYTVMSKDKSDNISQVSNSPSVTIPNIHPPDAPKGFDTITGNQHITLSWRRNTEKDLEGYRIYKATDNTYTRIVELPKENLNFKDTGLLNGKEYSYKITAFDSAGNESNYSNIVFAIPVEDNPPQFSGSYKQTIEAENQCNQFSGLDMENNWVVLSASNTVIWSDKYEGDYLPRKASTWDYPDEWVLDDWTENPEISSGILSFQKGGLTKANWFGDPQHGYTVEYRLKVTGSDNRIYLADDIQNDMRLFISRDHGSGDYISITSPGYPFNTKYMNLADYRTLRIVYSDQQIYIYADGEKALETPLTITARSPYLRLYARGEIYVDYVKYSNTASVTPSGALISNIEYYWKNIPNGARLSNFIAIEQVNEGTITHEYTTDGDTWQSVDNLSEADTSTGRIKFRSTLSRLSTEVEGPKLDKINFDVQMPTITVSPGLARVEPVDIAFASSEILACTPSVTVFGKPAEYVSSSGLNYTYRYQVTEQDTPGENTVRIKGTDLSGNTATDETASVFIETHPAQITDLVAKTGPDSEEITLEWTATGDDGNVGNIEDGKYRVTYADYYPVASTELEWSTDTAPGQKESRIITDLNTGTTYWFYMQLADEAGNFSEVSNASKAIPYYFARSTDNVVELKYESATVNGEPTDIYINETSTQTTEGAVALSSATGTGMGSFSRLYNLEPDGAEFSEPALFTFSYSEPEPPVEESDLGVYRWSEERGWYEIPRYYQNYEENYIQVKLSSTSIYAVLAPIPDTGPPMTELKMVGDYYISADTVTYISPRSSFTLVATDPYVFDNWSSGVTYTEYKIDENSWKTYESTVTISSEISEENWDGEHIIKFRSHDNAGNEEKIKELSVYMDITPPGTTLAKEGFKQTEYNDILYISGDTEFYLFARDKEKNDFETVASGIKDIYYRIDDNWWEVVKDTAQAVEVSELEPKTLFDEGSHALRYYSLDNVNNEEPLAELDIFCDKTAPQISITSPISGQDYIAKIDTVTVNFNVTDNSKASIDITAYLTHESGSTMTVTNGQQTEPLDIASGLWTLTVQAKDLVENSSAKTTETFEIIHDILSPKTSVSIGEPKYNVTGSTYITSNTPITLSAVDDLVEIGDGIGLGVEITKYKIDSEEWKVFAGTITLSAEGIHTLNYKSVDIVGNTEEIKSIELKIDNTSPDSLLISGSPIYKNTGNIYVSSETVHKLTSSDPVLNEVTSGVDYVSYHIDSGAPVTVESPIADYAIPEVLNEGERRITYSSVDNVSNTEAEETKTFKVDITAPETDFSVVGIKYETGNKTYINIDSKIKLTAQDILSNGVISGLQYIEYRTDSGEWVNYTEEFGLSEGIHTIEYRSIDNVENTEGVKTFTVYVDGTPPVTELSLTGPVHIEDEIKYINTTTEIELTADDPEVNNVNSGVSKIYYLIDNSEYSEHTQTFNLTEGIHIVQYYSTDNVQNEETVNERVFYVDGTSLDSSLTTETPQHEKDGDIYISSETSHLLSSQDPMVKEVASGVDYASYKVAEGFWTDTEAPVGDYNLPVVLEEGERTISYYGVDNVQNIEAEKTKTFKVDTTAPETDLSIVGVKYELGNKTYINIDSKIKLTAQDILSNGIISGLQYTEYRTDSGEWINYTENFGLSEGIHIIEYRSIDNVENTENIKSFVVYVDDTPPITTLSTSGPKYESGGKTYINTTTVIELTATDPVFEEVASGVNNIKFSIDGADYNIYSDTFTLTEGSHTVQYYSSDNVQNNESIKEKVFHVDETDPVTEINTGEPFMQVFNIKIISPGTPLMLTAADPLSENVSSGVDYIEYRIDPIRKSTTSNGASSGNWVTYSEEFQLSDGLHKVDYRATDNVQNIEVFKSVTYSVTYLTDYAAYAEGDLKISGNGKIYGDIRSNSEVKLSGNAILNGNVTGSTVTVSGENVNISGEISESTDTINPWGIDLNAIENWVSENNDNNLLEKNLKDGLLGKNLKVAGKKEIIVSSGIYYLSGIDVSGQAKLIFKDNVNIFLTGSLKTSGKAQLITTEDPYDLIIFSNSDESDVISGQGSLESIIYAPEKLINISGNGLSLGNILAAQIHVTGNAVIKGAGYEDGTGGGMTAASASALNSPDAPEEFKLGEIYSFPNPAKQSNPTIHFECGIADRVEIMIYNIAGELISSKEITSAPRIIDGAYAYEWTWDTDGIASGVYLYLVRGKKGDKVLQKLKKMAVIK